jgi:PAS domain S-box-containing protein
MRKGPSNIGARAIKNLGLAKKNQVNSSTPNTAKGRSDSFRSLIKEHLPRMVEPGAMANALIASIGDGLIIINEYAEISRVNQPALDILGFERTDLVGGWLPQVLPAFDKDGNEISSTERPSMRALLTGQPIGEIVYYRRKDGSMVPVYGTASPLLVKGRPAGAIIVFHDVSREMQIERAKDEFVSLASHQLRTPLTAIRMFAELLQDNHYGKLSPKQRDYLDKIVFSTDKMIELVTELLSISRLNLGQLPIKPVPTNINQLIENQLEIVKPMANEAGVRLAFKSQVARSEKVNLDRNLLGQVIHNLLTNAVRYSRSKGGRIEVKLKKLTKNYQIEVADNGIGIPRSARFRIYERFFRADNAVLAQGEGTGLGLYLVKEIMEASGGKTWYKSQEGKGTTFYVCIPLRGMKGSA